MRTALNSCTGKVKFESYRQAAQAAGRKPHGSVNARSAYRCKACNGFHVGSSLVPKHEGRR